MSDGAWTIVLGAVIGGNNLAVALAIGALGQAHRARRVILIFALYAFVVPLLGVWIGRSVVGLVQPWVRPISTVLLLALAGASFWSATRSRGRDQVIAGRITTWLGLLLLGAGLSIDNLVVGLNLGLADRIDPLPLATSMAGFTLAFTWLGIKLGHAARRRWETAAEVSSGLLLTALAIVTWVGWL